MFMVITTDQTVETSYPLFRRDKPTLNAYLLGRRVIEREVENALQAGITEITAVYEGVLEVGGSLPSGASAYWVKEDDVMANLEKALSRSGDDKIVLQLASFETSPGFYRFFLEKWSEAGGAVFTLLASTPTSLTYGLGGIRALIDFQTNSLTEVGVGVEGYGLTGALGASRSLILEHVRSSKNLLDLALRLLETGSTKAHVWPEDFVLLNEPRSFLHAIKAAMRRYSSTIIKPTARISPTAVIEGPVYIDDGAVIDHYAVIKGPVYVGPGAFVGSHTLIRNSVSIEPGAIIGSGAEVKRSYIGRGASIGSKCYIADSLVGDEAMVRPSCITINYDPLEARRPGFEKMGSIIGERSIVDSGSVLKPRTVIEPGTLSQG
jgi:glucose-1-phosphate thymidylyltransferase